jgi:hypothetical protein
VLELVDRAALQAADLSRSSGSDPRRGHLYSNIGGNVAKRQPAKRKPKKRGPKEERLVIRDDPKVALDRLLKKPANPKK